MNQIAEITQLVRPKQFRAGAQYCAAAGEPGMLVEEVHAIRDALERAMELPVRLLLDSHDRVESPSARKGWAEQLREHPTDQSEVGIYTSGTTGTPKLRWRGLAAAMQRKGSGAEGERWLLTFAPFRWAGVSVLLHAIRYRSVVVVPPNLDPKAIAEAGVKERATHVSLTPSLFRHLQLGCGGLLRKVQLRQVTFGGEAASQDVLDAAKDIWPLAKITHVYASSEFGDIAAVSDGLAGIPSYKFERPGFAIAANGELWINGEPTGDLWKRLDERYFFAGRVQDVINVGGYKVSPIEVEAAATRIAGVIQACAYGVASPLLGQIVVLDFAGDSDAESVRRILANELPKVARPARVRKVDSIAMTAAFKMARGNCR